MPHLTVPADLASLAPVSEFVQQSAASAGLDARAAYRLRLAVIELVTNTITHGYCEAGLRGSIDLKAELDEQELTVILEDTAIPYDPSQAPPPGDLDKPIAERKIGGLGVYLALQEVDSYRYERHNDRNRSILVMKRPTSG
jgi:anti-sigma regulatory factor (Ser/Thr protein kinase)